MSSDVEHEDMDVEDLFFEEHISSEAGLDEDVSYPDFSDAPIDDETIHGMTFTSTEEANSFYEAYGRRIGFKIRKCHTELKNGIIKNMKWECSLAGFRVAPKGGPKSIRMSKPDTRCGCQVCFRIAILCNGNYRVTKFVSGHNHSLEPANTTTKDKRYISPRNKFLLSTMKSAGIKTSQILRFLKLAEGSSELSFTNKDVHNFLAKERREYVRHGDAPIALSLLDGLKLNDKNFIYDKTLDEDGSLNKLFWTDGVGRELYKLFGDALVFDSTYQTNTYKFPFVILSRVDNNMRTCVFGAALIHNETYESFEWLLQTFLRVMDMKAPLSVVTDECASMLKAIEVVFPKTKHRLCNWHLVRNCRQHVPAFCDEFSKLTTKNCSTNKFKQIWKRITEEHGVAENSWVVDIYSKRKMWAEAYCRGHFTGMMRSNQRAESMNSRFKVNGKQGSNLCEFLKNFFNDLQELRGAAKEAQLESETPIKSANHAALRSFVDQSSAVYSMKIRKLVLKEIAKEQSLVLTKHYPKSSGAAIFSFKKYDMLEGKQWSVEIDSAHEKFSYECKMLETMGFPCRHLFSAFKQMGIMKIPTSCIYRRWTTTIGKQVSAQVSNSLSSTDPQRKRFTQLHRDSIGVCLSASQSESGTQDLLKRMRKAKKTLEDLAQRCPKIPKRDEIVGERNEVRDPIQQSSNYGIGNPKTSKSRGAPRNVKQKCGLCGRQGHKKGDCPDKNKKDDEMPQDSQNIDLQ